MHINHNIKQIESNKANTRPSDGMPAIVTTEVSLIRVQRIVDSFRVIFPIIFIQISHCLWLSFVVRIQNPFPIVYSGDLFSALIARRDQPIER